MYDAWQYSLHQCNELHNENNPAQTNANSNILAVSYTHLDVYKRQHPGNLPTVGQVPRRPATRPRLFHLPPKVSGELLKGGGAISDSIPPPELHNSQHTINKT